MSFYVTKNWTIKFLALFAAAIFWFFVLSSENTFFVMPDKLSIEPFNTPERLALVNELGTVTVTVRAEQDIFKQLKPEDFIVFVDLQGLAPGKKNIPISVNAKKKEVSVISVEPESVSVHLEEMAQKTMTVFLELKGEPARNYVATLATQASPLVTISGARSTLSEARYATAQLELTGQETASLTQEIDVKISNDRGQLIPNLTIKPETVEVATNVELAQTQKTVGIKINLINGPQGWLKRITTFPKVIQIIGDTRMLDQIDYLETEPLEIPAGRPFYDGKVKLIMPQGIVLAAGEDEWVDVSISITSGEDVEFP